MISRQKHENHSSRRAFLKALGAAPLLLRAEPFRASLSLFAQAHVRSLPLYDVRLVPHYPTPSPLADVLRLVPPGSDEYVTEKYAIEIESVLKAWGESLKKSIHDSAALGNLLGPSIEARQLLPPKEIPLRSGFGLDLVRRQFSADVVHGREQFLKQMQGWLGQLTRIETAEFEIYGIKQIVAEPLAVFTEIRYDMVGLRLDQDREERVGSWRIEWQRDPSGAWIAQKWEAGEETLCAARGPFFIDVTAQAFGGMKSYSKQMLRGADYWRTVLDGAIGCDVYGNNGVAAGDFDNDGFDDLYICQPAGLPNRLYRNRGDGTFEDVTEKAGVGVLDNTACALFADFENRGLQDLLVVCGTGPLLFVNEGDGTFAIKRDAFKFAQPPQGTFTHAAIADYDRDGRLDVYFCMYMYYLGLDQYHYPIPYYDARNGPPNCLLHNEGNWSFVETTRASGLSADNDRYSFACAWGDSSGNGLQDLFVANDFGSSQLYRNNGDGTFKVVSKESHVEDVGAGMSCCWCDFDNDGRQDIYVPSMWEAAGQRVSQQEQFHQKASANIRGLYQRHARGNALYRNNGDGTFKNVAHAVGAEMGRWSWSSEFFDFDHDGYSDMYVANGYLSGAERTDLASFFWRQVVAKSSEDAAGSLTYERGWNTINELVRSDHTWHGYARNVLFANNGDGTFTEVSGAVGLDFLEDSRTFVLADLDQDGRLEVVLKNRNAPQLRVLHNAMKELGDSIAIRLRGHKSNRDAIGASVTVEAGDLRQTKYLQAGSGFLAQHSKELFFGIGKRSAAIRAIVRWPSGLSQIFEGLPPNHRIEIEEGVPKFAAKPFAAQPGPYAKAASEPSLESLPVQVGTWLIQPLKAPEFSLPDSAGQLHDLNSLLGRPVLLVFWSASASLSFDQLRILHDARSRLGDSGVQIVAVSVDCTKDVPEAQSSAVREKFFFPLLSATEEVAGIYNIIYRYLFDRRRDLGLPTCFLLDSDGMIVKVYQGAIDPQRVHEDVRSIPSDTSQLFKKALPFGGTLYQAAFERNDFTYGVALFQHGYLNQAAASFKQVVATKPDNADGYYNLGTLALRRNDFPAARGYLEQALKLRPDYPEAWNNLGMMAAQQGHPDEAVENFQNSLRLKPRYAVALLNLGNVYRRQRAFEKARESLNEALEIQPDDPEISYSLGMLYAQQEDMESASAYLEKAIDLRPNYPEALNNLGVVFVHSREYAKAEEEFKTGIRMAPNYDQSYFNLARLYAMQNQRDKAKEVLQQLLTLHPENANAKQVLATLQ